MQRKVLTKLSMFFLAVMLVSCRAGSYKKFSDLPESHIVFSDQRSILGVDWVYNDQLSMQGFQKGGWPIYIGDASTGTLIPIYYEKRQVNAYQPRISPNGKWLAFSINPFENTRGVKIVELDQLAGDDFVLSDLQSDIGLTEDYRIAWSPDSSQLALIGNDEDSVFVVYLYDVLEKSLILEYKDTSIQSSNPYDSRVDYGVSWSSDGKKLAFSLEFEDGGAFQSDIYIYDFEQKQLFNISPTEDKSESYPSWLPDKNILSYVSTDNKTGYSTRYGELIFVTGDGLCTKSLPEFRGMSSPSWSPDGTELAYISEDGVEIIKTSDLIPDEFLSEMGLCKKPE